MTAKKLFESKWHQLVIVGGGGDLIGLCSKKYLKIGNSRFALLDDTDLNTYPAQMENMVSSW